ncbi:hypothetical protein VLK31_06970 [Variovorax sp. H27-G14]|uniref:hypothetical protein n=1 Tax=Variovorax sp. H27-G14 TaxID=3111914 RepID=UPI0038FD2A7A
MEPERITVDRAALHLVLQALVGPGHLIRELQATRSLHAFGHPNPIETLVAEFHAHQVGTKCNATQLSGGDWACDGNDCSRCTRNAPQATASTLHNIRHAAWQRGEAETVRMLDAHLGGHPGQLIKAAALQRSTPAEPWMEQEAKYEAQMNETHAALQADDTPLETGEGDAR